MLQTLHMHCIFLSIAGICLFVECGCSQALAWICSSSSAFVQWRSSAVRRYQARSWLPSQLSRMATFCVQPSSMASVSSSGVSA